MSGGTMERRGGLAAAALLLFWGAGCWGQNAGPSAPELAQRVDRHYNQLRSLTAGFTESYEGLGVKRAESGRLLIAKPGRMKWEYGAPAGKVFLLDGKVAWFYAPGDAQVERMAAKDLDDLRSPLRFLLGHTELEKEVGGLTVIPCPGSKCKVWKLTGQPKGLEKRVDRLTLSVTADGTITGIEMVEADGAVTRFGFSGEVPNAVVGAAEFRFTPPAGVQVVDGLPPV